jgi:Ca2+-transporting ATPase
MPLPLQPLQILWMNLVTDGPPALALGVEPAEEDVMRRPPQAATQSIFGHGMIPYIVVLGMIASVVSIGVGLFAFLNGDAHWQTLLFTTLIFSQAALALSVRSETQSLWKIGLRSNRAMLGAVVMIVLVHLAVVYWPALQTILGTSPLPPGDLLVAFLSATVVLIAAEVWKYAMRRRTSIRHPGSA